MECKGRNLDEHCCWVDGKVCPHLEENTERGQRWSCGLRRKLGSWDAVIESAEYKAVPGAHFDSIGINCRDWPTFEHPCKLCTSPAVNRFNP